MANLSRTSHRRSRPDGFRGGGGRPRWHMLSRPCAQSSARPRNCWRDGRPIRRRVNFAHREAAWQACPWRTCTRHRGRECPPRERPKSRSRLSWPVKPSKHESKLSEISPDSGFWHVSSSGSQSPHAHSKTNTKTVSVPCEAVNECGRAGADYFTDIRSRFGRDSGLGSHGSGPDGRRVPPLPSATRTGFSKKRTIKR